MFLELIEVKEGEEFQYGYKKAEGLKAKGNNEVKAKNY